MQHQIFKDECDNCKQMKICRGFKGKVLCEDCIRKEDTMNTNSTQRTKEVHYEQARLDIKT